MRNLYRLYIFFALSFLGCGNDPDNPYEENKDNIAVFTPASFKIERKVVGTGGAGFIFGDDTPIDFELWLYDHNDAVLASFPFRVNIYATGISGYFWESVGTNIKIRDFTNRAVRDILGVYQGRRNGAVIIGGQSAIKAENDKGVEIRIVTDRTGLGIDLSHVTVKVTAGVTGFDYSWDSIIQMTEPEQNW